MFTLRNAHLAMLAQGANAPHLLQEFARLGFQAQWEEGEDKILVQDPRGHALTLRMEEHGLIGETVSPLGRRQRFAYDEQQRLAAYQDSAGTLLEWTYGDSDRAASLTNNRRQRWFFHWDDSGNLLGITHPDNTTSALSYWAPKVCTAYKDRGDVVSGFERDFGGRLIALVRPNGARTRFLYGKYNLPEQIIYPDGNREEHQLSNMAVLSGATLNGQPWVKIEWDNPYWGPERKPKRMNYGDGHFVVFEYNGSGQVTKAVNPTSTITWKYDEKNRLIEENQNGEIVTFGYDAAGLLTSIGIPAIGGKISYDYDTDGRLTTITDWAGRQHTVEYVSERLVRYRYASGAVMDVRGGGALGERPQQIDLWRSQQSQPLQLSYEYNSNGQIARVRDSHLDSRTFQYDREGRITAVLATGAGLGESFAYDGNGNRIRNGNEQATYNLMDQLVTHGQQRMEYDERGNLIRISGPEGTTRYSYNMQNLLVAVDLPDGRHVEFTYDAFARRLTKKVDNVETWYLWAGDQLLSEVTPLARVPARFDYIFLPGSHLPFAMRDVEQTIYYFHHDASGRPRWVTAQDGSVCWSGDYYAFGGLRSLQQAVRQPFRFAGHYYDEETGLHYNRTRYYSPHLGCYLSLDPLELLAGLNLYTYANNDPLNECDPLGLLSGWAKIGLAVGMVALGIAAVAVAAPVILAVATGAAALTAGTMATAALGIAGGAAIGAGIGLGLSPDGCLQCQANALIKGALIGASSALAVMLAVFGAIGAGGAGAMALASGGSIGAGTISAAGLTNAIIGSAAASSVVMMASTGSRVSGSEGSGGNDKPASKRPQRVEENQAKQDDLVRNQQKELKDAVDEGGAEQKGRVLDQQGRRAEAITRDTLKEVPDAGVEPNANIAEGEGGQIDNLVKKGDKTVYVETKLTISDVNQRTINQLTNAVNAAQPGDSVILQVARQPTAAELENLQQALGDNIFSKVQVVSSQADLFDAVTAALK